MVSPRETDIIFYEDTLAWSEATGDDALASTLLENGPPPYDNIRKYEPVISHEHAWNPYPDLDTSKEMPSNLFVPENALMDRINGLRAFLDTFSVLYPQIQNIDFRQDAVTLDIPVYMVQGKYEAKGRSVLASQWFDMLDAPEKEKIIFEHSGHRPLFEEPAQFANFMAWLIEENLLSSKHYSLVLGSTTRQCRKTSNTEVRSIQEFFYSSCTVIRTNEIPET